MRFTRTRVLWLAVLALVGGSSSAAAQDTGSDPAPAAAAAAEEERLAREIDRMRRQTNWMRRVMGKRRIGLRIDPDSFSTTLEYRQRLHAAWKRQKARAAYRFRRPPHLRQWRCIQRYEGPWKDPDPPYYGGLQMDLTFQRMYGRLLLRKKGTANRWNRWEQMWVAERALRMGRGFYPWPNTARYCRLI